MPPPQQEAPPLPAPLRFPHHKLPLTPTNSCTTVAQLPPFILLPKWVGLIERHAEYTSDPFFLIHYNLLLVTVILQSPISPLLIYIALSTWPSTSTTGQTECVKVLKLNA